MTLFERERYSIDWSDGSDAATLHGVLRLASPAAYDSVFAPIRARIDGGASCTIDLSDVSFMNSSGIRALASLVMLAKDRGAALRLVASERVPWQKKTAASFRAISPGLGVELR